MRDPYWGWHRIYSICYNKRVRFAWERGKEEIVHAAVRIFQLNPDKVDKFKQKKNEDFLLVIREVSSFRAYHALDAGAGRIASVGVFDDRAGAEESIKMATDTIRQNMARLAPNRPEVLEGEVYATEAASAGPLSGATDAVRGVTDRLLGAGRSGASKGRAPTTDARRRAAPVCGGNGANGPTGYELPRTYPREVRRTPLPRARVNRGEKGLAYELPSALEVHKLAAAGARSQGTRGPLLPSHALKDLRRWPAGPRHVRVASPSSLPPRRPRQ
jgi:hypothetical protein